VKDFDYLHHLRDVDSRVTIEENTNREDRFPVYYKKGLGMDTVAYKSFTSRPATPSDMLLNWVRTHLWRKMTWSKREKKLPGRRFAYSDGEAPELFSVPTRLSDVGGQGRHEREEEGRLFYRVYKQAYIHERHECTHKCIMSKE
jgi:hypothetical protein